MEDHVSVIEQGDWLIPHGCEEPHRVREISYQEEPAGKWTIITFEGEGFWGVWYYPGSCKPVPMTKEILEKNGFVLSSNLKRYEYTDYKDDGCDKCTVHLDQKGNPFLIQVEKIAEWSKVEKVNIRSSSVHILQHSLKLCGILKNIEL